VRDWNRHTLADPHPPPSFFPFPLFLSASNSRTLLLNRSFASSLALATLKSFLFIATTSLSLSAATTLASFLNSALASFRAVAAHVSECASGNRCWPQYLLAQCRHAIEVTVRVTLHEGYGQIVAGLGSKKSSSLTGVGVGTVGIFCFFFFFFFLFFLGIFVGIEAEAGWSSSLETVEEWRRSGSSSGMFCLFYAQR